MGRSQAKEVLDELAKVFWERETSVLVLSRAGFPRAHTPAFTTAIAFWSLVLEQARQGVIRDGIARIIEQAAAMFPNNEVFVRCCQHGLDEASLSLLGATQETVVPGDAFITVHEGRERIALSAEAGEESPSSEHQPAFQQAVLDHLDDLEIFEESDFDSLEPEIADMISEEILELSVGKGIPVENLLHPQHLNLRFKGEHLLTHPHELLGVLNRKTAIYSDHSLVVGAPVSFDVREVPDHQRRSRVDARAVVLPFLRHRQLIVSGKLSVVPQTLTRIDDATQSIFRVSDLDAVAVNLEKREVSRYFTSPTGLLELAGTLTFNTLSAQDQCLEDILAIAAMFSTEYEHFQASLRGALVGIAPEDTSAALARELQRVEAAIRELDIRFDNARKQRAREQPSVGVLSVPIYSDSESTIRYLEGAVGSGFETVEYIPASARVPDEIRASPYFVPWVINRTKQKKKSADA